MEPANPRAELAIVRSWLIDTGPMVAYLDRTDPNHAEIVACLDDFTGQLVTTSAVITESMHFVTRYPAGPRHLADFVAASGLAVFDFTQPPLLRETVPLMEKYSDTPMDFADATLVLLGEELGIREILTLDRRGFTVFRNRGGREFRIVLNAPRSR